MSILTAESTARILDSRGRAFTTLDDRIKREPALDDDFSNVIYVSFPQRKILEDTIGDSQVIVVTGGYFGDEAKGKWGNILAELVDFVYRANSGANTGRTVYKDGIEFVFHNVPSAIVDGKRCYIGPDCVVDPISMMEEELIPLAERGMDYSPLKVGNFFITAPWHRIMDVLGSPTNSSTGVGIKATHMSMKAKSCARLDDLFSPRQDLGDALHKDMRTVYEGFIAQRGWSQEEIVKRLEEAREINPRVVPQHVLDFAKSQMPIEFLAHEYLKKITNNSEFPDRVNAPHLLRTGLKGGLKVLIEGTQSYFLSNAVEQGYRFSTSSDTTAAGVLASAGLNVGEYRPVIVSVLKFPGSTRVGVGNIPGSFADQDRFSKENITSLTDFGNACEEIERVASQYFSSVNDKGLLEPTIFRDETGEYFVGDAMAISCSRSMNEKGATTKKPRITGLFDCVMGAQLADAQGPYTTISAMDRGDDFDKVGIVVGYAVHLPEEGDFKEDEEGKFIDCNGTKYRTGSVIRAGDAVPNSNVLQYCHSITKVMDGWKNNPLKNIELGDQLPQEASSVVAAIEHYTGLKVIALGTGKNSEDAIYIRRKEDLSTKLLNLTNALPSGVTDAIGTFYRRLAVNFN
jgi:adenylosuccinate synthase